MIVRHITQPDQFHGQILATLLAQAPHPRRVVLVSAFAGLQTVMRFKHSLIGLSERGALVRLVIGVDMQGTSREVLQELASWTQVEVFVYRHRRPGHTFHPKIALIESPTASDVFVGSNNLTEGGLFRNYEAASHITYSLPADSDAYTQACLGLRRFLEPTLPLGLRLTPNLYQALAQRTDIPSEAQLQADRRRQRAQSQAGEPAQRPEEIFGTEAIPAPPPLPAELLDALSLAVNRRRRAVAQPNAAAPAIVSPAQIAPASFYMTLPTLQGPNIPGEGRIPLAAIEMAEDFWGWPDAYERRESPRGGAERVYFNWRSRWQIANAANPGVHTRQEVRMYMYENSSDFRFYARPLVNAGADLGDIVRITRIGSEDVDFECLLAHQGTPEHATWLPFCTTLVRSSTRRFGYG
ncbi:MAG: phospholipase D-like domain-containing protein [Verrucomicrobiota bacterium]|jgi:HKD family nuclease